MRRRLLVSVLVVVAFPVLATAFEVLRAKLRAERRVAA